MTDVDSDKSKHAWLRPLTVGILIFALGAGYAVHVQQTQIDELHSQAAQLRTQGAALTALTGQLETVAAKGTKGNCDAQNRLRAGALIYLRDGAARAERSYQATLADPTTSQAVRDVGLANLTSLRASVKNLAKTVPVEKCTP